MLIPTAKLRGLSISSKPKINLPRVNYYMGKQKLVLFYHLLKSKHKGGGRGIKKQSQTSP